jgi:DNA-binding transcriptional regulator GbsR (MarR family)
MQELAQKSRSKAEAAALTDLESQVIELFVDLAEMIGYPRSVGQLFGMLYISAEPMSMESLTSRLAISKGSASQGLKVLRTLGAVKTSYVPGRRRQHYGAEMSIRKITANFMRDQVGANLRNIGERLDAIENLQPSGDSKIINKIDSLSSWQNRAEKMLPIILKMVDRG